MEQQEDITGLKVDETVRTELAGAIRWMRAQVLIAATVQIIMAVFTVCYIRFYFRLRNVKPLSANEYMRIACWTALNIICYVIVLTWVYRYIRAAKKALDQNSQPAFQAMFRYMKRSAAFSVGLLGLSLCYYGWLAIDLLKLF
jgi:cbb3-type cytochrome oxidase subunit 3